MCYRISDMGLCKVQKGHTYTLDEFREVQFAQLEEVCHTVFLIFIVVNTKMQSRVTCFL